MDNCPTRQSLNVGLDVHPAPDGFLSLYVEKEVMFSVKQWNEHKVIRCCLTTPACSLIPEETRFVGTEECAGDQSRGSKNLSCGPLKQSNLLRRKITPHFKLIFTLLHAN